MLADEVLNSRSSCTDQTRSHFSPEKKLYDNVSGNNTNSGTLQPAINEQPAQIYGSFSFSSPTPATFFNSSINSSHLACYSISPKTSTNAVINSTKPPKMKRLHHYPIYLSTNDVRSSRPMVTSNSAVKGTDKASSKEKSTQDFGSKNGIASRCTSSMSSPKGNAKKEQNNILDGKIDKSKGGRTMKPRSEGENYLLLFVVLKYFFQIRFLTKFWNSHFR